LSAIYFADARQMPELKDASVHLVITSPPYWQLSLPGLGGDPGGGPVSLAAN
jgi:DNA modification methylase